VESVSIAALVISGAAVALAVLCLVRGYEWHKQLAIRVLDHEERITSQGANMARYDTLQELRKIVDAHIRKDDAGAKTMALALADRIDALSARLDAVELKTGLREKAKTAGGVD
jgi:hypothetical protein